MKKQPIIGAEYIRVIDVVLQQESPDLRHHLKRMAGGINNLEDVSAKRGQPVNNQFTVEMRPEDARAILEVLESCKNKYENQQIEGIQYDRVLAIWRSVVNQLGGQQGTEKPPVP